jgi:hypothetical protein
MDLTQLLETLGRTLQGLGMPYLVSGGMAVSVWGKPRFTADIDIVVELPLARVEQLAAAMKSAFGEDMLFDETQIARAIREKKEFNFFHGDTGIKIDFWILKDTVFDESRMSRRVARRIGKQDVWFSSPEDLILIKLQWYKESLSTRHLEDIESILKIQSRVDRAYLRHWALAQGTSAIIESEFNKVEGAETP